MKIELTPEQYEELKEDEFLDIKISEKDGMSLYIEYGSHMGFLYGEIHQSRIQGLPKALVFDEEGLRKLRPEKPVKSYTSEYKKCPSCFAPLIYQYECCPKCGQMIDWRED